MKSLLILSLFFGVALHGQSDSLTGIIRVSKARVLPYLSGSFRFTPVEPGNKNFIRSFRKAQRGEGTGRFRICYPAGLNFEKELAGKIKCGFSVLDTPRVDTIRFNFNFSPGGEFLSFKHAGGTIPPDDSLCLAITGFFTGTRPVSYFSCISGVPGAFIPGSLKKSGIFFRRTKHITSLGFTGIMTIVISSFPVTEHQKRTGSRFEPFTAN